MIIWIYGEDIQAKHDGKKFWYCYFCEKQGDQQELSIVRKGNCTALDHLEDKHSIDRSTGNIKPIPKPLKEPTQLSISDCNNMKSLIFARRLDCFKDMLVRWIVCYHIAFFQIENSYFQDLLFYLFPPLADLLSKAASTLQQWVKEAFKMRKEKLKQNMQEAHSNTSISFDLWTSPNYLAILGVIGHFIDKDGK